MFKDMLYQEGSFVSAGLTEVVFGLNNIYSSSVGRVIGVKVTGGIRKRLFLFILDPLQTYLKLFEYQCQVPE